MVWTTVCQGKQIAFCEKQLISKSAKVIIELVKPVILLYSR